MPEAEQPTAKGTVTAEKVLPVKSQADRRAAREGRENQPPTGGEVERVRHAMRIAAPGPASLGELLAFFCFLSTMPYAGSFIRRTMS
jgi:hypothetical protein